MKVAKIRHGGRTSLGLVELNEVRILTPWNQKSEIETPFNLPGLSIGEIEKLASASIESLPLKEVTFSTPLSLSSKIFCLGLNYRAHVAEFNENIPENPALFLKLADALTGHDKPISRPAVSAQLDYEGEIAVIIGRGGRHISGLEALSHVFGYTIMLDGSLRDYQKHSLTAGKNFWGSGALGPWVVTADEILDPASLSLETRLNGQVVQATTANLMIYDIPTAIEYISRWTPLAPGDVISMGTPAGIGASRTPPLWMKHGDIVEVIVSRVGILRNSVEDE